MIISYQHDFGPNVAHPDTYKTLALCCIRFKNRGMALPLARYRRALLEGYAPEWLDRF